MPGTGHSARYKGCISNRSKVSPFENLAKWNAQLLGADGMVPSITGGGGGLEFKKLNASDISGVMSNPATADLLMNSFDIKVGAEPYTIGENINGQFFIKTSGQTKTIANLTSPSFLIDPANGYVFINGVQLKTLPPSGYTWAFKSPNLSQGNRTAATISWASQGKWVDLSNATTLRFDGAADGINASGWAWTSLYTPSTPIPSNQVIHSTASVDPNVTNSEAFRALGATAGQKLSVVCTVTGAFIAGPTRVPDSALIWPNTGQYYYNPTGGTNNARFTYNYTLTVGIVKRVWNGTSLIQTNVASQDISIPFREGFYSRTADFSCSFNFSMEYQDANGYDVEYAPYFNHNGWMASQNQTAFLRRNGHLTVTFVTGLNHS